MFSGSFVNDNSVSSLNASLTMIAAFCLRDNAVAFVETDAVTADILLKPESIGDKAVFKSGFSIHLNFENAIATLG